MTRKLDLGGWIAGASAAAVVAAIVAGLVAVGNPGDVRSERIDAVRLEQMRRIAEAAQCALTFSGKLPADMDAIATGLSNRRGAVRSCDDASLPSPPASEISYAAAPPNQIELCADFLRASREPFRSGAELPQFPELNQRRDAPGRRCYRIAIADQTEKRPP
jgi:hypothetical protein